MRVVHVHRMRGIGGSERHLLTLLPALAEHGIDVSFVGLDDPAWDPESFYEQLGVPYERLPCPRDVDPFLFRRLARVVQGADVLHTHLVHADVYGDLGMRGTSSIQPPCARTAYVFALFAFQSARASVVSVRQPTATRLRIAHGASTTRHAATSGTAAKTTNRRSCQSR